MSDEHPEPGQEVTIKYKITDSNGEILDQTVGNQTFKFIVGDNQNIMKCVSEAVKTMVKDEKKTIEINSEEEPNILEILGDEKKDLPEYKKLKMEIELIKFSNVATTIFDLTDEEKYEHAQNMKTKFVVLYIQKNYKKALDIIREGITVMERIKKEKLTDEQKQFLITLLLNECNCMNNLKDYPNTVKVGKKIVEMDPKTLKVYYYMGTAYAKLDEFEDAQKCYDKLYELIAYKEEPGVVALKNLIIKRKAAKEESTRRKFKAYLASKDK